MKWSSSGLICVSLLMVATQSEECVEGQSFLEGIRSIIGMDPNVPREEVQTKPFTGSFSIIKNENDPALATTKYCLTDNACGHWEAYSKDDVPLTDLSCNSFCYISKSSGKYLLSKDYTTDNPPNSYFSCGWETCG